MRLDRGKCRKNRGFRRFLRAPVICAALVIASAVVAPSVVSAFSNSGDSLPVQLAVRGALGSFTPSTVDSRLVTRGVMRALANGRLFRFTPAGMTNRPDHAITVAVRITGGSGRLFASRELPTDGGVGFAAVRITPVAYNLGMARGYQSFALPASGPVHDLGHDADELRSFSLTAAAHDAPVSAMSASPRLAADVAQDETTASERSGRALGAQGDYQGHMGGSYRLSGNLDVTAGLRYASDHDRLRAITDHRQDSQAIYVGTKFRF